MDTFPNNLEEWRNIVSQGELAGRQTLRNLGEGLRYNFLLPEAILGEP